LITPEKKKPFQILSEMASSSCWRARPDPRRLLHIALVELSFQQNITHGVIFILSLGSLKAFNELDPWLVNGGVQFKIKLYKVLSLYTGVTLRFGNVPATNFRKLDTVSNLSLSVSFESAKSKPQEPEYGRVGETGLKPTLKG